MSFGIASDANGSHPNRSIVEDGNSEEATLEHTDELAFRFIQLIEQATDLFQ